MMIRLTGLQLAAARSLAGLTCDALAERAGLCRHSIRNWETSSHAIPGAMYTHLCRAVDLLESQGRASMGSTHYAASTVSKTIEVVLAFINSESLWTWLLGSVTPTYATPASQDADR